MLDGIKNFLYFINNNWTIITAAISFIFIVCQTIRKYILMSNQNKIEIAKQQIKSVIVKFVADAEANYEYLNKAGLIKKAQVIEKIFSNYPILNKSSNQEDILMWLNEIIDDTLKKMSFVLSKK